MKRIFNFVVHVCIKSYFFHTRTLFLNKIKRIYSQYTFCEILIVFLWKLLDNLQVKVFNATSLLYFLWYLQN